MKIGMLMTAVLFGAVALSAAENEFASPVYNAGIFDKWLKNSGLMRIDFAGKEVIRGNSVYVTLKGADGKNVQMREQVSPDYTWKDGVLTSSRAVMPARDAMAMKDGAGAATVVKIQTFKPDSITVKAVVRNNVPLTIAQTWTGFCDLVNIPTASVVGMRVEGTLPDGQVKTALIPLKYDAGKWGFRGFFSKLRLIGDDASITVTADPGCRIRFNHYGGNNIEMSICNELKQDELAQKAGEKNKIGYTIAFGKGE